MREAAIAKAVDFEGNIRDFIKLCLDYGGVPVFRTRYAGKRFDNLVLGICYRGKVKAHMWFKNVPSDVLEEMERTTGDWRWLLQRYPPREVPQSSASFGNPNLNIAVKNLSDADIRAAKKINELIDQRRYYGVREELAESDSTVIAWSNATRDWIVEVARGKIKVGERVKLDANEVLVPFSPARIERVKPFLKPLPLYMLSFEAKAHAIDPKVHSALWAAKQIESRYQELLRRKYV